MAKDYKISDTSRDAMNDAMNAQIDAGVAAGTIEVRTGAPPANPQAADTGTLLATLTASDPAFGASTGGSATANAIASTTAVGTGDAGHYRWKDSDAKVASQGTAGDAGDTPNLVFDNKAIIAGATVAITAFTHTVPEQGA